MKPFKFVLYRDEDNCWRWRLLAPNGMPCAESTKSYERRSDLENFIVRLKAHIPVAEVTREKD